MHKDFPCLRMNASENRTRANCTRAVCKQYAITYNIAPHSPLTEYFRACIHKEGHPFDTTFRSQFDTLHVVSRVTLQSGNNLPHLTRERHIPPFLDFPMRAHIQLNIHLNILMQSVLAHSESCGNNFVRAVVAHFSSSNIPFYVINDTG